MRTHVSTAAAIVLLAIARPGTAQNITFTKPVLRIGSADGDSSQMLFGREMDVDGIESVVLYSMPMTTSH